MDNLTRLAAVALADCYQEILESMNGFAEFEQKAMQLGFESMSGLLRQRWYNLSAADTNRLQVH